MAVYVALFPRADGVACYRCGGTGILTGNEDAARLADPAVDRRHWPEVPCVFTPGCSGRVEPDAVN